MLFCFNNSLTNTVRFRETLYRPHENKIENTITENRKTRGIRDRVSVGNDLIRPTKQCPNQTSENTTMNYLMTESNKDQCDKLATYSLWQRALWIRSVNLGIYGSAPRGFLPGGKRICRPNTITFSPQTTFLGLANILLRKFTQPAE